MCVHICVGAHACVFTEVKGQPCVVFFFSLRNHPYFSETESSQFTGRRAHNCCLVSASRRSSCLGLLGMLYCIWVLRQASTHFIYIATPRARMLAFLVRSSVLWESLNKGNHFKLCHAMDWLALSTQRSRWDSKSLLLGEVCERTLERWQILRSLGL